MHRIKSSSALLAALIAIAPPLSAEVDNRFYLGVTAMGGAGELEQTNSSNIAFIQEHDTQTVQLQLGYIFPSNNRFELSFSNITLDYTDYNTSKKLSGIDFDWAFTLNDNDVTPYLSVGFGLYTYNDTAYLFSDNKDLAGVAFNLGLGVNIAASEHLEFDIGIEAKGIGWEDVGLSNGAIMESNTSMGQAYLGVRLAF